MYNVNELKRLIRHKNELLEVFGREEPNSFKALKIKQELDLLLFSYVKSLRSEA